MPIVVYMPGRGTRADIDLYHCVSASLRVLCVCGGAGVSICVHVCGAWHVYKNKGCEGPGGVGTVAY